MCVNLSEGWGTGNPAEVVATGDRQTLHICTHCMWALAPKGI